MRKTKLQKLEDELKDLQNQCKAKEAEVIKHRRKYMYITCDGGKYNFKHCNKKFRIGSLPYIQSEWYVKPYSCTGGDYWRNGSVFTICPNCECHISIEDKYLLDRPNLFKEKLYERNDKIYKKGVYDR